MLMSICVESAWNVAARFMIFGNGTCALKWFCPLMTSVTVDDVKSVIVEWCVIVSIDSSLKSCKEVDVSCTATEYTDDMDACNDVSNVYYLLNKFMQVTLTIPVQMDNHGAIKVTNNLVTN